jgi:hypothetical protein
MSRVHELTVEFVAAIPSDPDGEFGGGYPGHA